MKDAKICVWILRLHRSPLPIYKTNVTQSGLRCMQTGTPAAHLILLLLKHSQPDVRVDLSHLGHRILMLTLCISLNLERDADLCLLFSQQIWGFFGRGGKI